MVAGPHHDHAAPAWDIVAAVNHRRRTIHLHAVLRSQFPVARRLDIPVRLLCT